MIDRDRPVGAVPARFAAIDSNDMRLAFIGGHGHFALRRCIEDAACDVQQPVAVAGDGYDDESARYLSSQLPGAVWYEDPRRMLDEYKPDVVNVGPIYGYTGQIAAMVLERGIPVVADKPVAATWEQLARLRDVTARTGAPLITELTMRSQRAFRAARHAVQSGAIGKVVMVTATKTYRFGQRPAWYGRRDAFGGLMLWVASHGIDLVQFCSDRKLGRVIGTSGNLSRPDYPEMEDHCIALFEFDGGGSAVVRADYLRPKGAPTHGDDRLRMGGTHGMIEIMNECCYLMDENHPRDITKDVHPQPAHLELLAAARGESNEIYSTQHSLEMAAVFLHARDAADTRQWMNITGR